MAWLADAALRPKSHRAASEALGPPVLLNIYHVGKEDVVSTINDMLAASMSPLKLGGIFHVAVEIEGVEWSYGGCDSGSGICCGTPCSDIVHKFRQTVLLGRTPLSRSGVRAIVEEFEQDDKWLGENYDILQLNCCHFADALCIALDVGGIPRWTHRLARTGDGVESLVHRVSKIVSPILRILVFRFDGNECERR